MASFSNLLRQIYSFMGTRSRKEEICAEHLIREHHRGRALDDILQDAYITNRLTPEQTHRLLDRQDVLHAIGEDIIAEHRTGGPTAQPQT